MLFSQRWLERMNGMTTERIEAFWQDATADDVARVMAGETVEARFRNSKKREWENGSLRGWSQVERDKRFWDQRAYQWLKCQVYREPSWWTNKPDPGPGYRLLGKFEPEALQDGDEWFDPNVEAWRPSENASRGEPQNTQMWYRRRMAVEPKTVRLDEGSKCPVQGCSGALRFRPVKDCSCHIRPPCSHCADNPPCCPVCEWTSGDPIEPVEPEPKHYVLRIGDSVETPSGDRMKCVEPGVEQRHYALRATDTVGTPNGQTITITEKGFEVAQ
jgi:hypothetical protein